MNKVVSLAEHYKRDYEGTEGPQAVFPGFSARMNELLDNLSLDVPSLDKGRITFIAELTGCSRQIVSVWLTKDKPPRDGKDTEKKASLFKLVAYFMKHIQTDVSLYKIVAWLRYGDEAIESPFKQPRPKSSTILMPIAASVIVEEANAIGISTSSFVLQGVLDQTVKLLSDFNIQSYNDIEPAHRAIIQQYVNTAVRKE